MTHWGNVIRNEGCRLRCLFPFPPISLCTVNKQKGEIRIEREWTSGKMGSGKIALSAVNAAVCCSLSLPPFQGACIYDLQYTLLFYHLLFMCVLSAPRESLLSSLCRHDMCTVPSLSWAGEPTRVARPVDFCSVGLSFCRPAILPPTRQ